MKWGTDLADRLLVPCWVEASIFGHHLYEKNGFRDVEEVCTRTKKWVNTYTMTRREPKTRLYNGLDDNFERALDSQLHVAEM